MSRHECASDLLPKVCAHCGAPAAGSVALNFSWEPRWAKWLVVAWFFVVRTMPTRLPLCNDHLKRRRRRGNYFLLSLLTIMALAAASGVYVALTPSSVNETFAGYVLAACLLMIVAWFVMVMVAYRGDIQATRITDRSLTLDRVHEAFVAAMAEARDRQDPNAHRRFGDLRDDFDDADEHS